MTTLHRPGLYPPAVRVAMQTMPPLAMTIANDWMRHWPMRTRTLIEAGEFPIALLQATVRCQEAEAPGLPPPPEPQRR